MASTTNPGEGFRFDVAFSFAGPHREKVLAVAQLVAASIGQERVFFSDWYEHELLGVDMDVLLQRSGTRKSKALQILSISNNADREK
jgi:hypothetical protein